MASGALVFGILLAVGVFLGFVALWRLSDVRDPVEERMQHYGVSDELGLGGESEELEDQRRAWPGVNRLLGRSGLGPRLATALMRAGVPLTATEFTLIILAAGVLGFALGTITLGPLLGLVLGGLACFLPILYLRSREGKRRRAITWQLPDALTLLVGALRAGYGLSQALETLVDNMGPPLSEELGWVVRMVSLGMPVDQALAEMAARVDSDDLALVVTAINVQSDMGGNLAQTLEAIGETVRARIRLFRQIRVLTAQQRLTSYVLTGLPIFMAIYLFLVHPDYIGELFQPGWVFVPIAAVVLQILGFFTIRKIVDIEV